MNRPEVIKEKMNELLEENNFDENTLFYRYTLSEYLTEEKGSLFISANPDPTESVVNIYGGGHTWSAKDVGPGLAFIEKKSDEWNFDDRICVKVKLADLVSQGGLLYPVESVITSKTWYITFPESRMKVSKI